MPALTFNRPGVVNGDSDGSWADDNELFLKLAGDEVLVAFDNQTVTKGRHRERQITHGKSYAFPAIGKSSASYNTPGTSSFGSTDSVLNHAEVTVNVDDILEDGVFIYELDEMKAHYDVRGPYTQKIGESLANEFDRNVLITSILAARASANVSGGDGGSVITDADSDTNGESLAGSIFEAVQKMDEKNVPDMQRYAYVAPAQYYLMAQTTKLINKDWGGAGVYADGSIYRVAGAELVKTNNLPSGTVAAKTGQRNTYSGTFNTSAIVTQYEAVGTVQLLGLTMSMTDPDGDFYTEYNGHFMKGKFSVGHGPLRPECGVEVQTSAP